MPESPGSFPLSGEDQIHRQQGIPVPAVESSRPVGNPLGMTPVGGSRETKHSTYLSCCMVFSSQPYRIFPEKPRMGSLQGRKLSLQGRKLSLKEKKVSLKEKFCSLQESDLWLTNAGYGSLEAFSKQPQI
ncbi:MAG TPA: hypothetical protein VKA68_15840 [bacterium]|nr:hypothetical protein [bacterium]